MMNRILLIVLMNAVFQLSAMEMEPGYAGEKGLYGLSEGPKEQLIAQLVESGLENGKKNVLINKLLSSEELSDEDKDLLGTYECKKKIEIDQDLSSEIKRDSTHELRLTDLGSYCNVRKFVMKLVKIGWSDDRTITLKDVLKLCKSLELNKILELFSMDPALVRDFFHVDKLRKYISYLSEEEDFEEVRDLKAAALRESFKIPAWEKAFSCINLRPAVVSLSKLVYFNGTAEEKIALLKTLKLQLANVQLIGENEESSSLEYYVDMSAVYNFLDVMEFDKKVSIVDLIQLIKINPLVEPYFNDSGFQKTFHIEKVFKFLVSLLLSEQAMVEPFKLVNCLRWDTLVDDLPFLVGSNIESFFNLQNLRKVVSDFQLGKPLSQALLKSVINRKIQWFFEIENYVDFEDLALALNNVRQGKSAGDLTTIINLEKLGKCIDVDLECFFDKDASLDQRKYALKELFDLFIDDSHLQRTKERSRNVLATLPLVWLTYHYPYTGGFCLAAAGLYYITEPYLPQERSMSIVLNIIALRGPHILASFFESSESLVDELLAKTRRYPEKESLKEFILLCQDHLTKLSKPIAIFQIFSSNEVLSFIATNEEFVISMCSGDPEQADKRIQVLYEKLKEALPVDQLKRLSYYEPYRSFCNSLKSVPNYDMVLRSLPHKKLLALGEYRPRLIALQKNFIEIVKSLISEDGVDYSMYLADAVMLSTSLDAK